MSEIEKMYENAEVKKQIPKICSNNELYCKGCKAHIENAMPYCKNAEYPPFTAEKQLKLVEFFISSVWWLNLKSLDKTLDYSLNFENKLAKLVNRLWQEFTKEQQQQVKGILE